MPKPADSLLSFADVYGTSYERFPQQQTLAGSGRYTLIDVEQQGHETSDPGVPEIVLRLVTRSEMTLSDVNCGDGRTVLSGLRDSFYLAPADAIADWRSAGDHSLQMIAIPHDQVMKLIGDPEASGEKPDPLRSVYGRDIFDPQLAAFMRQVFVEGHANREHGTLIVDGLIQTMIGLLAQVGEKAGRRVSNAGGQSLDEARLARVLEYVDANLASHLSVAELADIACFSVAHFARAFKVATGSTPHAFVTGRRLGEAKLRLSETDAPLSAIALECGFSSQAHFSTAFKSAFGVSPGQSRKELRRR